MSVKADKEFGTIITRLIQKENLSRKEARKAFSTVLNNGTTQMQQGAFLSSLTAKGETAGEVAGSWEAIYDLDTTKVFLDPDLGIVENSGTGMDTFKTFNISTAASIIAAAGDIPMALGRILSQIFFGSTLNIAASLANPALPTMGVRGVYSKNMILPVAEFIIDPKKLGLDTRDTRALSPEPERSLESKRFASLMNNKESGPRKDAALLNAGLIFLVADKAPSLEQGIEKAALLLEKGKAFETLENWVATQNTDSEKGLKTLHSLV